MRNVQTVAANTFREAVRDRVLYNLVFFALLMIGVAILVGQISIGIERDVIVSLGLTAISVIGISSASAVMINCCSDHNCRLSVMSARSATMYLTRPRALRNAFT